MSGPRKFTTKNILFFYLLTLYNTRIKRRIRFFQKTGKKRAKRGGTGTARIKRVKRKKREKKVKKLEKPVKKGEKTELYV